MREHLLHGLELHGLLPNVMILFCETTVPCSFSESRRFGLLVEFPTDSNHYRGRSPGQKAMNSLIGLALTALSGSEGVIWGALEGLLGAVLGRLGGLLEKVPESSRGLEVRGKVWGAQWGPLWAFLWGPMTIRDPTSARPGLSRTRYGLQKTIALLN